MAASHSSEPLLEPKTPWNRAIRKRWQELIQSGSSPAMWNRSSAFSSGLTVSSPTIAFVVARRLLLTNWLLVFDEIQLLDVSSANLLADVLSWFWRMGGVIVATSNKVPEDLYQNGVQKERLGPFVDALKARCPVITMQSDRDWRVIRGGDGLNRSWFISGEESQFDALLKTLITAETGIYSSYPKSESDSHYPEPQPRVLHVFGRALHVPWTSGGVCRFSFSQLCQEVWTICPYHHLVLSSLLYIVTWPRRLHFDSFTISCCRHHVDPDLEALGKRSGSTVHIAHRCPLRVSMPYCLFGRF